MMPAIDAGDRAGDGRVGVGEMVREHVGPALDAIQGRAQLVGDDGEELVTRLRVGFGARAGAALTRELTRAGLVFAQPLGHVVHDDEHGFDRAGGVALGNRPSLEAPLEPVGRGIEVEDLLRGGLEGAPRRIRHGRGLLAEGLLEAPVHVDRAQVAAHARDHLGKVLRQRAEILLAPARLAFGVDAVGDVEAGAGVAAQLAVLEERHALAGEPAPRAVAATQAELEPEGLFGVEGGRVGVFDAGAVIRMDAVEPAEALLGRVVAPGELLPGLVEIHAAPVGRGHPDHDRCEVGEEPKALRRLAAVATANGSLPRCRSLAHGARLASPIPACCSRLASTIPACCSRMPYSRSRL
jgi:hypothetical protein